MKPQEVKNSQTNVEQLVEQTLSLNKQNLEGASDKAISRIKDYLFKIFEWRSSKNSQVVPYEVHILRHEKSNELFISLHWRVYARAAMEAGYTYAFELIKDAQNNIIGEKVIIKHQEHGQFEYPALYAHYQHRESNIWRTNFSLMFKKTILKEAFTLYCPDLFTKMPFTLTVFYDQYDVENQDPHNTTKIDNPPVSTTTNETIHEKSDNRQKSFNYNNAVKKVQIHCAHIIDSLYKQGVSKEQVDKVLNNRRLIDILNYNELVKLRNTLLSMLNAQQQKEHNGTTVGASAISAP